MIIVVKDYVIKPYVRMTKRGKYVNQQALEYMSSKEGLQLHYEAFMSKQGFDMLPPQTPIWVMIIVTVPKFQGHRADLDNIIKAVLDAGNKIVYPDDRWIDSIEATREIGDPKLVFMAGEL